MKHPLTRCVATVVVAILSALLTACDTLPSAHSSLMFDTTYDYVGSSD